MKILSYKDLIVWQKSIVLVLAVYELTDQFPKSEVYVLSSQLRRAALSIPSNIAEGRRFCSRKDFQYFLRVAYGSGAELETQLMVAKLLPFGRALDFKKADNLLEEVMKMLNRMISNLAT